MGEIKRAGIRSTGRPELLAQAQDKPLRTSDIFLRQTKVADERIRVYFQNGEVAKIEHIHLILVPEGLLAGQYKNISRYLPGEKCLEGDSDVWAGKTLSLFRYGGPKNVPLTNEEKLNFVKNLEQAIKICDDPVVRTALKRARREIKGSRLSDLFQGLLKKIKNKI